MDTADVEITSKRQGSQRFWIGFDQTTPITVNDGGNGFKFFCNSEKCVKYIFSVPLSTVTQNIINISCTQSCQVCVLKHFIKPDKVIEGGGVYINTNSVTYQ